MTTLPAGWKPRLSCPFCGSNFLFTEPDEVGSGGQWVSPIHVGCNDCKAEQVGDTEDEAVSRWNARFTPPATTQDAPITVSLDPDPRGVSVGVWQGSRCIYNGAHAVPAPAAGDALPTIKGAAITGGYVVVTPAGWGEDKPQKVRDAILRLFPVNPAYTPKPEADEAASQQQEG